MFNMAKNMMGNQIKDDKQKLLLDTVDEYANQLATIASVMDVDYEGGDFCAGLTVSYEIRSAVQEYTMDFMKGKLTK